MTFFEFFKPRCDEVVDIMVEILHKVNAMQYEQAEEDLKRVGTILCHLNRSLDLVTKK